MMARKADALRGAVVAASEEVSRCKDGVDDVIRSVRAMRTAQLVRDANAAFDAAPRTKPFTMDIDTATLTDSERSDLSRGLGSTGFNVRRSGPGGNTLSIRKGATYDPSVAVATEMGRVLDPEIPRAYRNFAIAAVVYLAKPGLSPTAVMRMTMQDRESPAVMRDLSRALAMHGLICRDGQVLRDGELRWTLTIARKGTPAPVSSRKRAASRSRGRATATHKRARQ